MSWRLKPNQLTSYGEGDLVSSLNGDFTLKYVGAIRAYALSTWGNIICVNDAGDGEYLGIAIDTAGKFKMISSGNTPGLGTATIPLFTTVTLEIRYIQSTNTASAFINNVFEYSVNPGGGATTWIPNLTKYRVMRGGPSASFGNISLNDGTSIIDVSTPANTIELTPTDSDGTGLILPDSSLNSNDCALISFTNDDSQWFNFSVTSAISGVTWETIQGFCRNSTHWFAFDSTFTGGFVNALRKYDLVDVEVDSNTSPFSDLPASSDWKFNDGCIVGTTIYNIARSTLLDIRALMRYDSATLDYISHTDITATGAFSAGVCQGHTSNFFAVGNSQTPAHVATKRVTELTEAGVFVAEHTLSEELYGMQGITYDGQDYYISINDQVNNVERIVRVDTSFNVLYQISLDIGTTIVEMEGIDYFEGEYYFNDIAEAPLEFFPDVAIPISITITESGPSFTEAISSSINANLSAAITESGPVFTESIAATITPPAGTRTIIAIGTDETINYTTTNWSPSGDFIIKFKSGRDGSVGSGIQGICELGSFQIRTSVSTIVVFTNQNAGAMWTFNRSRNGGIDEIDEFEIRGNTGTPSVDAFQNGTPLGRIGTNTENPNFSGIVTLGNSDDAFRELGGYLFDFSMVEVIPAGDDRAWGIDQAVNNTEASTLDASTLTYNNVPAGLPSRELFTLTGSQWIGNNSTVLEIFYPLDSGTTADITESGPSFTESITVSVSVPIEAAITESGPSFTESISASLTAKLNAAITEAGPSFTESITATVMSQGISVNITENGPSFTESIVAGISKNIIATITEQGPSFTESINVQIIKDITVNITENGPSFTESIIASIPIKITVNPRNIIRVKRTSNNVTIKRKSNTIRVR